MDELLTEALAPALQDVERAGLRSPLLEDVDWSAGDADDAAVMMWDGDGSGQSLTVPRSWSPAERVVAAAEQVQEWVIESQLWGAAPTNWPQCPAHADSHPLLARLTDDGTAAWTCPRDGSPVASIGEV